MEQREIKTELSSCGICYFLVLISVATVRHIHDKAQMFSVKRKDKAIPQGFKEQVVKLNARHLLEETIPLHIDTKQLIEKGTRRDITIQRHKVELVHDPIDGADININDSWMEKSTNAAKRKELAE